MQSSKSGSSRFSSSHTSSSKQKSQKEDPTSGWTIEEMLESTLDENGNAVPDPINSIDGKRMSKGERGFKDEGDVAEAATADFD